MDINGFMGKNKFQFPFGIQRCFWSIDSSKITVYTLDSKTLATHSTYSWNIKWQKCAGISGLWILNEIIQKKYPENMKKIVGAVWKLPAK